MYTNCVSTLEKQDTIRSAMASNVKNQLRMVFNKKLLARKEILLQFSCPDACSLVGPMPRVLTFVLPRGSTNPSTTCSRRVRSTSLSRSNSGECDHCRDCHENKHHHLVLAIN